MKDFDKNTKLYPLSNSQLNIWSLEQSFQGTSMNNICETIRIHGTFDIALLQKCLNLILESDCSLRTQIALNQDHLPMQYEQEYIERSFPVFDFSTTNQHGIEHWENSITREVMPVLNAPLFYFAIIKISEHEGGVLVKTHHLISDGWSQVSLINRIAETYLALLNGQPVTIESTPSYQLHVEDEARYLESKAYARDKKFWKETLQNLTQPISIKETSNAELSPVGQRKTFFLSEKINHALSSFCTSHRVAPFAVFYMVIAIYLKRVKGANQICIGSPIHNRTNITDRKTTGMFVSTLPFFSELDENWSFEEFNDHLSERWLDLLRHQKFPFIDICSMLKQEKPELNRLFHLVLSFHNSKAYRNRDTAISFSGQWHYAGYQAEHLCIHLNNIEDERRFSVNYDYLTQLFSKYEIEDFHHYLVNILTQVLAFPELPIHQLCILGEEEEEKVLFTFNRTESFIYSGNVSQKLEEICINYATRVAVIEKGERFTYHTLLQTSELIAAEIFNLIPNGKEIVAIFMSKSYHLFCAMTAILRSGCAFLILSPELPQQRISQIVSSSGASMILTTLEYQNQISVDGIPTIIIDSLSENSQRQLLPCPAQPTDLAYLVYTSGSTGAPKGVEIEQQSLINFAEAMSEYYAKGAVLSLCNISFDAFLLESIVSLLNGQTIVLPSAQQQENPSDVARLILSYGVGFVATTPSRLTAYLKNFDFQKACARLESIICGGEAFPSSLLRTLSRITNAKIYNQYGPSETTIGISTCLLNGAPYITVGAPMKNCRCYVLDQHLKPLPIGIFGDLFIGGLCVGRGYHNAPELTENVFLPSPFEPGERIYRTGDIAAFTEDGELILKGREDGQVKLRGQRIELEEIASCLMLHPSIQQTAVRLVNIEEQILIVAYYVAESFVTESELLEFSATYLPGYMIPSVFEQIPSIPLTANGKVNYHLLPIPTLQRGVNTSEEAGNTAKTILSIFEKVLGRSNLGVSDDYFLCGGDSLNALETLSELEACFGVRLRVVDLYACRTASRLAKRLDSEPVIPILDNQITKAPSKEYYPLTSAQLGIYFETQMSPNSTSYNMPCGFRTVDIVDCVRLESALQRLIDLDPLFRTAFLVQKEGIFQRIYQSCTADLEIYRASSIEKAKEAFVRPFDLSRPPLLRVGLWQSEQGESMIMMDMHHIIGDATTAALTLQRLNELYQGNKINLPEITYHDYADWLEQNIDSFVKEDKIYWEKQMENIPESLDLPTDYPRPKQFDYKGSQIEFFLSEQDSLFCEQYCEQNGLTPYMFFTGMFGLFLSKLSGSNELLVGTPISSRRNPSVAQTTGLFVNTLPVRLAPNANTTIAGYLKQVKDTIIGVLDHPYIPLDELITMSGATRRQGQNPLYNTIISMRPIEIDQFTFNSKPVTPVSIPSGSAKVDLNLEVSKSMGCYQFRLEYAQNLYAGDTISLYSRSMIAVIHEILRDDTCLIEECSAISPMDRYQLMEKPNHCRIPFSDLPIDRQIDAIADMMPDASAFIFHDNIMTFAQLKTYSDALAAYLIKQGVKPNDTVGLLCKRGPELAIAMLGILKTGSAYVPMLPSFPKNRIEYMIETSGASFVLSDNDTLNAFSNELACQMISIETAYKQNLPFTPVNGRDSSQNCFVLFTSGSTGNPKGVMIRHRAVSNLVAVLEPELGYVDGGFLCTTNCVFDVFTTEILLAMAYGKSCVMADEEEMMLPWKAAELIKKHNVKLIQFTPSRAQVFFDNHVFFEAINNMPIAILCGEAFPQSLLDTLRKANCKKILNLYGPTEATVYCAIDNVTNVERITIGRVFPNCRGYILNESLRPVMPTAIGELYFAGECLSNGYIGRGDLTKEQFLPDPFVPGEMMYRSGDIGRLLPDGRIDYLGRRDHQIKLNGQRIELGEITQKILEIEAVSNAATIVKKDGNFMTLIAFAEEKEGQTLDASVLRKELEKELPSYMVPSEIHILSEFPHTASGKVDLKKLESFEPFSNSEPSTTIQPEEPTENIIPEPVSILEENKIPPQTQQASSFSSHDLETLWKETLCKDSIDPNISFFEQGGTSLAALTLLSSYYNSGVAMSLADFYEHNTLLSQLDFLGIASMKELPSESTCSVLVEKDTNLQPKSSDFEVLVDDNIVLPKVDFIKSNQRKNAVFLTGATGFFGAHLVKALLEAGYEKIFCLVRGENPSRLYDTLSWYFGNGWTHFNQMKIKAIQGDLLQQNFGIAGHIADQMIPQIGYVIHAGADVRHYATDNLAEKTNREGTANAIQLAKKAQAKLIHISTVSLCAEYIINSPEKVTNFSETDFEIGQNWGDNVYLRGKFAAEELVRQAVNDDSVSATILRIGRLVGRSSDGVFQKNASTNAFWGLVNGISCLTKISKELSQFPLEMTAVDECAQAAVLLMNSHQLVYHLFNPHLLTVKEIFTLLDRPIVEVNKEQFEQHLREQAQSKNAARIAPLLSQYYHLMQVPFRITPICDLTTSELSKYRFVWKKNDPKILLHSFFENDGKETFAY